MKLPRTILTLVFVLLLAGFAFGLVLHALTYLGVDPRDSLPTVWYAFQLITALLFIPFVISALRETPQTIPRTYIAPRLLLLCVVLFLGYAVFNWAFTEEVLNHGKTPEILDGQYVMIAHSIATPITQAEYLKHRVYEARANSGHWMALWGWMAIWWFDHTVTRTEKLGHSTKLES
jgi:uncharacterized membrane protein